MVALGESIACVLSLLIRTSSNCVYSGLMTSFLLISSSRSTCCSLDLIKRADSKYVLLVVCITSSIRSATLWHEKQKNVPLYLSTSPAGVRWLGWNGQNRIKSVSISVSTVKPDPVRTRLICSGLYELPVFRLFLLSIRFFFFLRILHVMII